MSQAPMRPSLDELVLWIEEQQAELVAQRSLADRHQSELAAQRLELAEQRRTTAMLQQRSEVRADRACRPWRTRLVAVCAVLAMTLQPAPALAIVQNGWNFVAPMNTARVGLAAATGADGKIYAFGGHNHVSGDLNSVEAYDPASDMWTTKAPMSVARFGLAAVSAPNGKIYAIGGANSSSSALGTVSVYDLTANTWSAPRTSLPTARRGLAAVLGPNGKIYTIGGQDSASNYVATIEVYDPATNTWTCSSGDSSPGCTSSTLKPMPSKRTGLAAVTGSNGKIYAIGGDDQGFAQSTVEVYDPWFDSWGTAPSLPYSPRNLAAVSGSNGEIYVVGGGAGVGSPGVDNDLEAFDPGATSWTSLAGMHTSRTSLAAARGPDGMIYAIGGFDGSELATAEAYTPAGGQILGDTRNIPGIAAIRGISNFGNGGSFGTGQTAAPLHLDPGGAAVPSGTFHTGDFYVTSGGVLEFYNSTGWHQVSLTVGPTDARVTHLRVRQVTGTLHLTWRMADGKGVAGFEVYAGSQRLNLHTITTHRGRTYHYVGKWNGRGPYSLHVIMSNGSELTVRA